MKIEIFVCIWHLNCQANAKFNTSFKRDTCTMKTPAVLSDKWHFKRNQDNNKRHYYENKTTFGALSGLFFFIGRVGYHEKKVSHTCAQAFCPSSMFFFVYRTIIIRYLPRLGRSKLSPMLDGFRSVSVSFRNYVGLWCIKTVKYRTNYFIRNIR